MGRRVDEQWTDVRYWPGMRSEYSWLPPRDGVTRTKPEQVGVSFSSHRAAVYEAGARTVEEDIPGGAVFVTGREPIVWNRVRELTEAVEIYPDRALLGAAELAPVTAVRDGSVLAIASVVRRAHVAGGALSDIAASTVAHQFVIARRMDRAVRLLAGTSASVLDVAHAVGLSNVSHFRRMFNAHIGVLPGEVRKNRPSPRRRGV